MSTYNIFDITKNIKPDSVVSKKLEEELSKKNKNLDKIRNLKFQMHANIRAFINTLYMDEVLIGPETAQDCFELLLDKLDAAVKKNKKITKRKPKWNANLYIQFTMAIDGDKLEDDKLEKWLEVNKKFMMDNFDVVCLSFNRKKQCCIALATCVVKKILFKHISDYIESKEDFYSLEDILGTLNFDMILGNPQHGKQERPFALAQDLYYKYIEHLGILKKPKQKSRVVQKLEEELKNKDMEIKLLKEDILFKQNKIKELMDLCKDNGICPL